MIETYHATPYSYGIHTVKVTAICQAYQCEVIAQVRGNLTGGSILQSVLSSFEDGEIEVPVCPENQRYVVYEDSDMKYSYVQEYILFDAAGNSRKMTDITRYIVGAEVIEFKEITLE